MVWASRRRLNVVAVITTVLLIGAAIIFTASFYRAPSCTDKKQNQGEAGIDCGGPCAFLCTAQNVPPITLFTGLIHNATGRTDLIASIENKNFDAAAKNVQYKISLYTENGYFIKNLSGTVDLPPRTVMPIFVPGISVEKRAPARAFLAVATSSPMWYTLTTDPRNMPIVSHTTLGGTTAAPRIEAVLTNESIVPIASVRVIVFVRDTNSSNIIAASATVVPTVPAQGQTTATFTWNEAFASPSVHIEVIPVIPLP